MLESKALLENKYEDITLAAGGVPTEDEIRAARLLQLEIYENIKRDLLNIV